MTMQKTLSFLVLCVAVFAASFAGTMIARSQPTPQGRHSRGSPLARWLDLSDENAANIEQLDPNFEEERRSLQEALATARSALAELLEDAEATNDQIRARIEDCITKHNALEWRVADYLLAVRKHLTAAQQKKLFRLCAEGVRKGRGHGWGRGAGRGRGERCECCGRGGGGRGQRHDGGHDDQ